jgi:glycosyltransferase involved in cell wall biosynthesis
MKVALLNTYERSGGAAVACGRLFSGLKKAGINVQLLVREKSPVSKGAMAVGSRLEGRVRALLDGLPLHAYPRRQRHNFSPALVPGGALNKLREFKPDVVHLHWVVEGFMPISAFQSLRIPIIWTLHDSWPFTGGCHLPGECTGYARACGECPVLGSSHQRDLSKLIWQRKAASWKDVPITIVSPSRWLADKAGGSSLFANRRIEVIPNGVDIEIYQPGKKLPARRALGLPEGKRLLLYGANHAFSDPNKGFELLQGALLRLPKELRLNCSLVCFGERGPEPLPNCGLPIINLGAIGDEQQIALLYRAVDVFVLPSFQENYPNMVLEAMACGTPCVAFAAGGIPEIIRSGETGYLANPFDLDHLASQVGAILADEANRKMMSTLAQEWIRNNVSLDVITSRYISLYWQVATGSGR